MTKARDLANAGTALTIVSATELGYLDGVTSAVQTQIDTKAPTSTTATLTGTQTLTNKTIDTASNTITGAVTLTGTQTLTNKTLTSPVISTISNTGTVTLPTATDTLVGRATTDTLTNKTLTSPAVTGGTLVDSITRGLEEDVNVVASAATGTINLDVATASIWYYTSNATANHTLNIRYSSGTSLNSALATGDAITVVWMNTNGTTAYYPNVIQIDGTTVTPRVPSAITSGNASSIDLYTFTIIKTAATPTYVVLESQQKFA
jgi:hypothetical protein